MPKISFHGLCGFARRPGLVQVLMPAAKAEDGKDTHQASMLIDLAEVDPDPKKTTWPPDVLVNSPDGKQLGLWWLIGPNVSAGSGNPPTMPGDLINLAALHPGANKAVYTDGAAMSLKGGELAEGREYPVELKLQNHTQVPQKKIDLKHKDYTEVVEWRSKDRDISNGNLSVTLKNGNVRVAISNAAPGLSAGHEGLHHFHGYYTTFKVVHEEQIHLETQPGIDTAGAGNCVPNAELP